MITEPGNKDSKGTKVLRFCAMCGSEMWPRLREIPRGKGIYCSPKCLSVAGGTAAGLDWWRDGANMPLKKMAEAIYRKAVGTGELKPKALCENCEADKKLSGHHVDYAKPLDVVWLCAKCHIGWHMKRWGA